MFFVNDIKYQIGSSTVNVSQDFIERKKHKNKINETNTQSCYIVAALHYLAACPISFILSHDLPDKKKKPEASNITHVPAMLLDKIR